VVALVGIRVVAFVSVRVVGMVRVLLEGEVDGVKVNHFTSQILQFAVRQGVEGICVVGVRAWVK